jgi:hypothetical protein
MRENPLITGVSSRTQFERCRPRTTGEGVALLLAPPCRDDDASGIGLPRNSRLEQE